MATTAMGRMNPADILADAKGPGAIDREAPMQSIDFEQVLARQPVILEKLEALNEDLLTARKTGDREAFDRVQQELTKIVLTAKKKFDAFCQAAYTDPDNQLQRNFQVDPDSATSTLNFSRTMKLGQPLEKNGETITDRNSANLDEQGTGGTFLFFASQHIFGLLRENKTLSTAENHSGYYYERYLAAERFLCHEGRGIEGRDNKVHKIFSVLSSAIRNIGVKWTENYEYASGRAEIVDESGAAHSLDDVQKWLSYSIGAEIYYQEWEALSQRVDGTGIKDSDLQVLKPVIYSLLHAIAAPSDAEHLDDDYARMAIVQEQCAEVGFEGFHRKMAKHISFVDGMRGPVVGQQLLEDIAKSINHAEELKNALGDSSEAVLLDEAIGQSKMCLVALCFSEQVKSGMNFDDIITSEHSADFDWINSQLTNSISPEDFDPIQDWEFNQLIATARSKDGEKIDSLENSYRISQAIPFAFVPDADDKPVSDRAERNINNLSHLQGVNFGFAYAIALEGRHIRLAEQMDQCVRNRDSGVNMGFKAASALYLGAINHQTRDETEFDHSHRRNGRQTGGHNAEQGRYHVPEPLHTSEASAGGKFSFLSNT